MIFSVTCFFHYWIVHHHENNNNTLSLHDSLCFFLPIELPNSVVVILDRVKVFNGKKIKKSEYCLNIDVSKMTSDKTSFYKLDFHLSALKILSWILFGQFWNLIWFMCLVIFNLFFFFFFFPVPPKDLMMVSMIVILIYHPSYLKKSIKKLVYIMNIIGIMSKYIFEVHFLSNYFFYFFI